jgi:hypothetical protein
MDTILEGLVSTVTVLDILAGFALSAGTTAGFTPSAEVAAGLSPSAGGATGQDSTPPLLETTGAVGITDLVFDTAMVELVQRDSAVVTQVDILSATETPLEIASIGSGITLGGELMNSS